MIRAIAIACLLIGSAFGLGMCGDEASPSAWIADGRGLAYFPAGSPELRLVKPGDGSSEVLLSREALAQLQDPYEPCSETSRWQLISSNHSAKWLLIENPHKIVLLNLATRRTRVLLSSQRPVTAIEISPDGRWISFLRNEKVELLEVESGFVRPLVPGASQSTTVGAVHSAMRSQFDMATGYWWAPDSSAIAYLESDNLRRQPLRAGEPLPSTTLWVCSIRNGATQQVDVGGVKDRYVPFVRWFPDSRRLLTGVLNREQNSLSVFAAYRSARPPTLLLEDRDPYWVNISSSFQLMQDGPHLLWSSERSGYRHLELYDFETHVSRPLTSGRWEVTDLSHVNEQDRQVYLTTTLSSPTERGLYRISLDGGTPVRVSSSSGTHVVSFSPDGTAYVDIFSDLVTPPNRSVHRADGTLLFSLDSAEPGTDVNCPPQLLTIRTHQNARLEAALVRPSRLDSNRRYPVVIEVNGEPRHQMVRNAWDGSRTSWRERMAEHGYVILTLDCRGSGGHGHRYEEPLHYRLGAQEMSDVRDAVDWLRRLPYVDGGRIGIWGSSPYNGFLAVDAILTDGGQLKAAVAQSPILDWKEASAPFVERYLGPPQSHRDEYEKSSPLEFTNRFTGKLLVVTPHPAAQFPPDLDTLRSKLAKTRGSVQFVRTTSQGDLLELVAEFFLRNL